MRDTILRAFFYTGEIEQPLDSPAAKARGDVGGIEVAGGWAGVIEVVDFAHPEFAAGVHADAGGLAIDCGEDAGASVVELLDAPGLVEALFGLDLDHGRKVRVGGGGDPMGGDVWDVWGNGRGGGAGEDVEALVGIGEAGEFPADRAKQMGH